MAGLLRWGRWGGFVALATAYALLAHYTNTRPHLGLLGALVALAPILLAGLSLAWYSAHRALMLALFAIACIVLLLSRQWIARHFGMLYWIEHAGTQLVLCLAFGRTLYAGREPMCTRFARIVHGRMAPPLAHYTRQVTKAWAGFFGAMAAGSTILFYTASPADWSLFAYFFTAPLIMLMFAVEYAVRKQVFPDMKHASILEGVKAFWKTPASKA